MVKVGGELVSLPQLNKKLQQIVLKKRCDGEWFAFSNPDDRLGFRVDLATTNPSSIDEVAQAFRQKVLGLGLERFQGAYIVDELPKNHMGKVQVRLLQRQLGTTIDRETDVHAEDKNNKR